MKMPLSYQCLHRANFCTEVAELQSPDFSSTSVFQKLAGFSDVPPARKCYFVVGNLAPGGTAFYPGAAEYMALHFLLAG